MPLFGPNMNPIPSRPVHHPAPFLSKLAQPTPQIGLQLTVSGLQHDHPRAAISHIQRLVHQYNHEQPADTLPSLAFTPPESKTPVDYVYVVLSPIDAAQPRADLLERARQILSGFNGIRAYWKVNNGPDVSRRVYFQARHEADANALKPFLDKYLGAHNIATQGAYVDRDLYRVVYDIVAHESVPWLFQNPPMFDEQPITPEQHRFVEPVHGLEVAVTGLKEIHNAADVLHSYITTKYGDVIASERMMLDHDVYCVVFKSWDTTSRVLREPFTAFSSSATLAHYFPTSEPLFLYVLNTAGVPTNPVHLTPNTQALSSEPAEVMALSGAIKELEQKVAGINSCNAGLANICNVLVELSVQGAQIAQALAFLCWSNFVSDFRATVDSNLNNLQKERIVYEHRLSHSTDPFQRDQLRAQIRECANAIDRQKQAREEVVQNTARFEVLQGPVVSSLQNVSEALRSLAPGMHVTFGANPVGADTESSGSTQG